MASIIDDFPSADELKRQIMLTSSIVWQPNDITLKEIDKWLANFKGEVLPIAEEQILALWLLNHFVFYNEHEIRHLCKLLYKEFVHRKLMEIGGPVPLNEAIGLIHTDHKFHFLGDPAESGAYVLYYFRQENFLPMKYFLKNVNTDVDVDDKIIFIDDVTLTGDSTSQAFSFFNKLKPKGAKRVLLTFVATHSAVSNLKGINVDVISPIVLEDRNRCFHASSDLFIHHSAHLRKCELMAQHYGQKIANGLPLGYRNGQLNFGFFYNTPDNTLPIFWADKANWYPIVKRYDKKKHYHFTEYERFV